MSAICEVQIFSESLLLVFKREISELFCEGGYEGDKYRGVSEAVGRQKGKNFPN